MSIPAESYGEFEPLGVLDVAIAAILAWSCHIACSTPHNDFTAEKWFSMKCQK